MDRSINGHKQESLAVSDRATQFGDGCFTTARVIDGKVSLLSAHIQRLQDACQRLMISCDFWPQLELEMKTLAAEQQNGVLKVVIDLLQAGGIGLLNAVERYDALQGTAFTTYAVQRIRGAMLDELRSRDWVPRSVRRNAREVAQAIGQLEQELGRNATETEVAERLGIDQINSFLHGK